MDQKLKMEMQGKWEQGRGRVKEAWGALTDDDLIKTEGQWDRVVGAIREKTGETLEAVEEKLEGLFAKKD